jgi:hypothetical protein
MLEKNIQISLQAGQIGLEDAIDIREINNIKLANQYLKLSQKKKSRTEISKRSKLIYKRKHRLMLQSC